MQIDAVITLLLFPFIATDSALTYETDCEVRYGWWQNSE
jgi:hypothetical protein